MDISHTFLSEITYVRDALKSCRDGQHRDVMTSQDLSIIKRGGPLSGRKDDF